MDYTGTRFATSLIDGYLQLGGTSGAFVSNKLSDQPLGAVASVSNAGELAVASAAVTLGRVGDRFQARYPQCALVPEHVPHVWRTLQPRAPGVFHGLHVGSIQRSVVPALTSYFRMCANVALNAAATCRELLHQQVCARGWHLHLRDPHR
jgi:hypothetical protein